MLQRTALLLLIVLLSCHGKPVAKASQAEEAARPPATPAADSASVLPGYTRRFDGARAWAHLHTQVAFGPRVPGTDSHTACRHFLEKELTKYCDKVERQELTANLAIGPTKMYNLIGRFNLDAPRRILLAAHWDSRPTADYDVPAKRKQPISGANDGASGVAVLLELARLFHETPPPVGVDIVLFDGEDYGPSVEAMFFGSRYFAKVLSDKQARLYNYGILLDMIGDSDLGIPPEANSEAVAGDVFAVAYQISRDLGYYCFEQGGGIEIMDDHLPLIARGIRMYDFIDFDYPYWHTTKDTEDKCSADSLEAVGRTLENMVYLFPNIYAPQ
jgi:glutaminyl-peptide cyclotransferase